MEFFISEYSSIFNQKKNFVLDFGSHDVNGSYRPLFSSDSWNYTGLDLTSGPNVDLVTNDPYEWAEIEDEKFDLVISGQALEHCDFFWLIFLEIKRVLKPNGHACIIAPSSGPEHKYPVDCWRFYPDGMKALCNYSGLELIKAETEWNPPDYEDGSQIWKDTILVAKKPIK